jgi:hypothetical protein
MVEVYSKTGEDPDFLTTITFTSIYWMIDINPIK